MADDWKGSTEDLERAVRVVCEEYVAKYEEERIYVRELMRKEQRRAALWDRAKGTVVVQVVVWASVALWVAFKREITGQD